MAESTINQPAIDPDPRKTLPDKDMAKLLHERWEAAKDWRSGKETQWTRWYKLYRSYAERKDWPHSVSLFIPLIWATVESFLPRMVVKRPTFVVEARGDEKLDTANFHREVLEYQWSKLRLATVLVDWIKEAMIYGTGIVKVGWDKLEEERTFRIPLEGGGSEEVEQTVRAKDQPFVSLVAIENFYPEPGAADMETARFVFERKKMTWDELDDWAKEGFIDQDKVNALKDKKRRQMASQEEDRHRNEKFTTFGTSDPEQAKDRAMVWEFEVVEYWEDRRYAVYVPDLDHILANRKNPFWHQRKPYLRIVDNSLPGEFFGIGEPEVLQSINMELNELHNLRLEAVKRASLQMYKVRINSPVTPNMVKFKPQGVVWVTSQDDVEPLFTGSHSGPSHREEDSLRMWAQLTSGANDPFMAAEGGLDNETATGASILAQAAASRVGMKFLLFSEMGMNPLGEILVSLNEQFMDRTLALSIVGPEGENKTQISPADLATGGSLIDVKIDVGATDPLNRELKLQKTMNFLNIMGQLFGDPNHPAMQQLIRRIADLAEIPLDPELLGIPPDPDRVAASGGDTPDAAQGEPATGSVSEALTTADQNPGA